MDGFLARLALFHSSNLMYALIAYGIINTQDHQTSHDFSQHTSSTDYTYFRNNAEMIEKKNKSITPLILTLETITHPNLVNSAISSPLSPTHGLSFVLILV